VKGWEGMERDGTGGEGREGTGEEGREGKGKEGSQSQPPLKILVPPICIQQCQYSTRNTLDCDDYFSRIVFSYTGLPLN